MVPNHQPGIYIMDSDDVEQRVENNFPSPQRSVPRGFPPPGGAKSDGHQNGVHHFIATGCIPFSTHQANACHGNPWNMTMHLLIFKDLFTIYSGWLLRLQVKALSTCMHLLQSL